tara:strand:+ start:6490 stop:7359 length:870 start_codon:yes stop_codon:yes gene_type:complete
MIEYIIYTILGIIIVELVLRVVVSIFIYKSYSSVFSIHVPLWKVFNKFGKIKKKNTINKFRFEDQASFMGLSNEEFIKISSKASNTSEQTITKSYTGYDAFERLEYQPFVGLFNSPNQKLTYATTDKMGAQGNLKKFEKPHNVKRLLVIGGSVAFGIGATTIENNITSKLIKYLNQELNYENKIKWEVINLAFVSSQTTSELNLINKYSELYNPDYVIHLAGFNDLYFYLQPNSKLYSFNFSSDISKFLYSSNLIKVIEDCSEYSMIFKVIKKILTTNKKNDNQIYTIY